MIQHQVKNLSGGKTIEGKPFQILGFDFLIDQNLKAWILEVNDHPSLNIYFDTAFMQTCKMEEEDICQVDLYVKSRVVTDAITISRKKSPSSSHNSLTQIFNSEDCTSTLFNCV